MILHQRDRLPIEFSGTAARLWDKPQGVVKSKNTEESIMKKVWNKPAMCQVEAGFEISRYLPAELKK
jgi:hypothetical protein